MNRPPWRYALPLASAAFAAALIRTGIEQTKDYLAARNSALAVWDYMPPAAQISHMVNFPAFAASSGLRLLTARGLFVETAEYLVGVVMFWYFVGLWADYRSGSFPHKRWGAPLQSRFISGALDRSPLGSSPLLRSCCILCLVWLVFYGPRPFCGPFSLHSWTRERIAHVSS